MPDECLISSTQPAPWLPAASSAEAWAGADCTIPDPCIIVRLLLVRRAVDGAEFFCIPTHRGLDLPSLALTSGPKRTTTAEGLASLARTTHGRPDVNHRCVGYIRNVVHHPDASYPHPTPWAHVPVFAPEETVAPTREGIWVTLDSARPDLAVRHWWPIVEHRLPSSSSR